MKKDLCVQREFQPEVDPKQTGLGAVTESDAVQPVTSYLPLLQLYWVDGLFASLNELVYFSVRLDSAQTFHSVSCRVELHKAAAASSSRFRSAGAYVSSSNMLFMTVRLLCYFTPCAVFAYCLRNLSHLDLLLLFVALR